MLIAIDKKITNFKSAVSKLEFNINLFRELTKQVIADEKQGFWSDWTKEEQEFYTNNDWESFSRSRGYSEKSIKKFKEWLKMRDDAESNGFNPYELIKDLSSSTAIKNALEDTNNEIAKSSHIPRTYREKVSIVENIIKKIPGSIVGDAFPLKHSFAKGCYLREIKVPAGNIVVTKIHKVDHPCFILKGVCSVIEEDGPKIIKAPAYFITKAGTKRIVYVHEETVWVTVHITDEQDIEKIEEQIIAKDFNDPALTHEGTDMLKLEEGN